MTEHTAAFLHSTPYAASRPGPPGNMPIPVQTTVLADQCKAQEQSIYVPYLPLPGLPVPCCRMM